MRRPVWVVVGVAASHVLLAGCVNLGGSASSSLIRRLANLEDQSETLCVGGQRTVLFSQQVKNVQADNENPSAVRAIFSGDLVGDLTRLAPGDALITVRGERRNPGSTLADSGTPFTVRLRVLVRECGLDIDSRAMDHRIRLYEQEGPIELLVD